MLALLFVLVGGRDDGFIIEGLCLIGNSHRLVGKHDSCVLVIKVSRYFHCLMAVCLMRILKFC